MRIENANYNDGKFRFFYIQHHKSNPNDEDDNDDDDEAPFRFGL